MVVVVDKQSFFGGGVELRFDCIIINKIELRSMIIFKIKSQEIKMLQKHVFSI
jgi:hypothetical protein